MNWIPPATPHIDAHHLLSHLLSTLNMKLLGQEFSFIAMEVKFWYLVLLIFIMFQV